MPRLFTALCLALSLTFTVGAAEPSFSLIKIFGNNMVIQRDREFPVWGVAEPGAAVEVTLTPADTAKLSAATATAKTGADGHWRVTLPAIKLDKPDLTPWTLTAVCNGTKIEYTDILVGEVWHCSGQSNMEWELRNSNNAEQEIANGDHPTIRHFTIGKSYAYAPNYDFQNGEWKVATPKTVGSFRAIAYFFAREINRATGWPIGLIDTAWGGAPAQPYVSLAKLRSIPELAYYAEQADENRIAHETVDPAEVAAWQERNKEYHAQLQAMRDAVKELDKTNVAAPEYDDSAWEEIQLPNVWENALPKYADFDGVAWHRRVVEIPANWAGRDVIVSLGWIDDFDITFWNGEKIGETPKHAENRNYRVAGNLVKAGANTIAIRVQDNGGNGGVYSALSVKLADDETATVSLEGAWKFFPVNAGLPMPKRLPPMPGGMNGGAGAMIFNAMVAPIVGYPIRGVIWYQGESNVGKWKEYRTLFPALIADWREQWGDEFPFYWVQLANLGNPDTTPRDSDWARLREAQTMTLSVPKTGQAVAFDIGDAHDIHPRNKQDVGLRLALIARHFDYGEPDLEYSGPLFDSLKIDGAAALVKFTHTGAGLKFKDDKPVGFAIAGADEKFVNATAKIIASDTISLTAEAVPAPVSVRYAWAGNTEVTLENSVGLPAVPFRTDKIGD